MRYSFEKYIIRAMTKQGLVTTGAVVVISLVFAISLIWITHTSITQTALSLGQIYGQTINSHISRLLTSKYLPEFHKIMKTIEEKGIDSINSSNVKVVPYDGDVSTPTITTIELLFPDLSIKIEGITVFSKKAYKVEYYTDGGKVITSLIKSIINTIKNNTNYISDISVYDNQFHLIIGKTDISEIGYVPKKISTPTIKSHIFRTTYLIFPIQIPITNGTLYMLFSINERGAYAITTLIISGILIVIILSILISMQNARYLSHILAGPLIELANIVQKIDVTKNNEEKNLIDLDRLCKDKPEEICILAEKLESLYEKNKKAVEQIKREQEKTLIAYDHAGKKEQQLYDAYYKFATTLANLAERHDDTTGKHIKRVGEISGFIAEKMGLPSLLVDQIRRYAPLHDIGKIMVPDNILQKQGALTEEEWELMKKHTIFGAELIGDEKYFMVARNIALYHHERYDGSGYPFGLKGNQIPIEAQITAIADVYDALRDKRPYKPAFTHEEALKIILEGDRRTKPSHFNPKILEILKEYHTYIRDIYASLI